MKVLFSATGRGRLSLVSALLPLTLLGGACGSGRAHQAVVAGQEGRGSALRAPCFSFDYFARSTESCWDQGRASAYYGGGAAISTCNGDGLPIAPSEGEGGALLLESRSPSGWATVFVRYEIAPVNFRTLGPSPVIELRLRWDLGSQDLLLRLGGMERGVPVSRYARPSRDFQRVHIPVEDLLALNPHHEVGKVTGIELGVVGQHEHSRIYLDELRAVESRDCVYHEAVKVNQAGYLPALPKLAFVSYPHGADAGRPPRGFALREEESGKVVHRGALTQAPLGTWDQSGDQVLFADFTGFTEEGRYRLEVPDILQTSVPFEVSARAYVKPFRDALRFFYYARSGQLFAAPHAEGFEAAARHPGDVTAAYDYKSGTRDVSGGWHDAGDAHKDVHAQLLTLWMLLETIEQLEAKVRGRSLGLPEADGSVSDLFFLAKWGLDWIAKMQNPDGSVHYWVDYAPSYFQQTSGRVSGISTGAASTLAALFAKAYPLYKTKPEFSAYADDLLSRARASFAWLGHNMENVNPQKPGGGVYGYELTNEEDQRRRALAAVELYVATGEASYRDYFESRFADPLTDYGGNLAWAGVIQELHRSSINLTYLDYVEAPHPVASRIATSIREAFRHQADRLLQSIEDEPYKPGMVSSSGMLWGSNWLVAANVTTLMHVYRWTGDVRYRNGAYEITHWLLGRNPTSFCFVSGNGSKRADFWADGGYWDTPNQQPPGYVPGGINTDSLRPYIADPFKRFTNYWSAPVTEPWIGGNASVALALGYFAP
jgi:endoglucanase